VRVGMEANRGIHAGCAMAPCFCLHPFFGARSESFTNRFAPASPPSRADAGPMEIEWRGGWRWDAPGLSSGAQYTTLLRRTIEPTSVQCARQT
jgi:hypothetical protein